MKLSNKNGTILIVALWTLVILTLLALGLGRRVSLEISLAGFDRDKLKALELAKAAIEKAILEKQNDTVVSIDALSESWAVDQEGLQDKTIELDGSTVVYRMEDEAARINLNTAAEDVLINLFSEYDNAETIAEAVIFWRGDKQALSEDYYKGGKFKTVCELLLVPGVSEEILYGEDKDDNGQISAEEKGLADYLTVYGEGKVNINTASEMVLAALIGSDYPELAAKVISYRDDYNGWFSLGREQIELETGEIKQLKNLSGLDDPTDEFEPGEWDRLKQLAGTNLTVSSDIYAISAQAEVEGAKKSVSAIVKLRPAALTEYLFFYRN